MSEVPLYMFLIRSTAGGARMRPPMMPWARKRIHKSMSLKYEPSSELGSVRVRAKRGHLEGFEDFNLKAKAVIWP